MILIRSGQEFAVARPKVFRLKTGNRGKKMPKRKTKKAVAKRFWKTGTGKLMFRKSGGGHLLVGKSRKRRRNLHKKCTASPADSKRIGVLLLA